MKYLLDTNPIIDALKLGLNIIAGEYLISFISEIELLSYHKLSLEDESVIKDLLLNFSIININDEIKEKTIQLRKKYKLKLPDSIVVATAIIENAILITGDKQLHKIKELSVLSLNDIISE